MTGLSLVVAVVASIVAVLGGLAVLVADRSTRRERKVRHPAADLAATVVTFAGLLVVVAAVWWSAG